MGDFQTQDSYNLPCIVHSRLKWHMHLGGLFLIALFASAQLMPMNDAQGIFVRGYFAALTLFFVFTWLHFGVFKKPYVEMDEEGVSVKMLFKAKHVAWTDIGCLQIYYLQKSPGVGIITKQIQDENATKGRHKNFLRNPYSLSFNLNIYPDLDFDKVRATMIAQCQKEEQKSSGTSEVGCEVQ